MVAAELVVLMLFYYFPKLMDLEIIIHMCQLYGSLDDRKTWLGPCKKQKIGNTALTYRLSVSKVRVK